MITIGIDPGISGAIAVLCDDQLIAVHDMPVLEVKAGKTNKRQVSPQLLADILYGTALPKANGVDCWLVLEKVGAMPGQGVTSMFNFGRSFGVVEGVAAGLGLGITYVTPQVWQKRSGKKDGKDGSRQRVIELYPSHADLFKRAKDDGRADAVLIARYGMTG